MNKKQYRLFFISTPFLVISLMFNVSCYNPFSTRTPEKPDPYSGAAIKPANSPENVLWNLRASFESLSVQDYLEIFSDDFVFNPDSDDSLKFEEDFRNGWGFEEEKTFAENFLQKNVTSEIYMSTHSYEYRAGEDMFDYVYSIMVLPPDSTQTSLPESIQSSRINVKGHAWIYLRENLEGIWKIHKWVEIQPMTGVYITWGVLRRSYI